jgi:hypothetical protein
MSYTVTADNFRDTYDELKDMYEAYYKEMCARETLPCPDYNPRVDEYMRLGDIGEMITYVLRDEEGVAKGCCNVFLANDMHNQDLIAIEDTIYIAPDSRGGKGKAFGQCILQDLQSKGVKRFIITVLETSGIAETCRKAGFRDIATQMVYTF